MGKEKSWRQKKTARGKKEKTSRQQKKARGKREIPAAKVKMFAANRNGSRQKEKTS